MHEVELLLVLLAAIALLSGVARHLHIAYPILFVVGGLLLALMPGVPSISLAPELVFLLFFSPLLYAAASESSPRDLRDNLRPIGSLAVGYVLASIVLLAIAAHVIGMVGHARRGFARTCRWPCLWCWRTAHHSRSAT